MSEEIKKQALEELANLQNENQILRISYSPYQNPSEINKLLNECADELYGRATSYKELNLTKEEIREHLTNLIENSKHLKYENPIIYHWLKKSTWQIERAMKEIKLEQPIPIVFGTLQIPEPNAYVWLSQAKNCGIVGLNAGIYGYMLRFSRLLFQAIKLIDAGDHYEFKHDIDDVRNYLKNNPEAYLTIQRIIDAIVMRGNIYDAPRISLDLPKESMVNRFLRGAELFLVGHEYGHVISGHLFSGNFIKTALSNTEIERMRVSHEEEFQADFYGLYLSIVALTLEYNDVDLANTYCGIDFFLTATDILERSLSLVFTGQEYGIMSPSHPLSNERRKKLRERLPDLVYGLSGKKSPQIDSLIQGAIKFAKNNEEIIEELWPKTKMNLLDYYNKGLAPAYIWNGYY